MRSYLYRLAGYLAYIFGNCAFVVGLVIAVPGLTIAFCGYWLATQSCRLWSRQDFSGTNPRGWRWSGFWK